MEHTPSRLAKQLVEFEQLQSRDTAVAVAAGRACDRLFMIFSPILGFAGMRALFGHSIKRVKANPSAFGLLSIELPFDGTGRELARAVASDLSLLTPGEAETIAAALFEAFFELVIKLIGEALVAQIMTSAFTASGRLIAEDSE